MGWAFYFDYFKQKLVIIFFLELAANSKIFWSFVLKVNFVKEFSLDFGNPTEFNKYKRTWIK